MWKKWVPFTGLMLLIVMLDPTHTPAQPGGERKGGFGERRDGGFPGAPTSGMQPNSPGSPGSGWGRRPEGGSGSGFPAAPPGGGQPGFGGPPGGGTGGPPRGRGMDPERGWHMLSGAAGGNGEVIDLSKIPPQTQAMMKGWAERSGGIPLPETGIMTKAQYLDHYNRSEAAKAQAAASGGPPSGFGGPPGGFGGPPGGGMNSDELARRFRERDRNGDGKLSYEEASDRLKPQFKQADTNGDGFIDLNEYGTVFSNGGRPPSGDPNNPQWGPGGWNGQPFEKKETEEERPVAMRYGKLPQGLPDWYDSLDTDKDGQVGLYEWRTARKETKEFTEMDLNGDGLVTADEYLRFARQSNIEAKVAAYEKGERGPGNWGLGTKLDGSDGKGDGKGKGFGPGYGSKSGDNKGSEKGGEKSSDKGSGDKGSGEKGKGNPWRKN